MNALDVKCPTCGADRGEDCKTFTGKAMPTRIHTARGCEVWGVAFESAVNPQWTPEELTLP